MVLARRRTGHCYPVLPGPSAANATRAKTDVGGGRGYGSGVHEDLATRGRSRIGYGLPPALQTALARALRFLCGSLSRFLQTQTQESQLCAALAGVVCPGTPGRGFRRNICDLVNTQIAVEAALQRLAGITKTRVYR